MRLFTGHSVCKDFFAVQYIIHTRALGRGNQSALYYYVSVVYRERVDGIRCPTGFFEENGGGLHCTLDIFKAERVNDIF